MKTCNHCKEEKNLSDYYFRKSKKGLGKGWHEGVCRDCYALKTKRYRINNPEKSKASDQSYYQRNKHLWLEKRFAKEYNLTMEDYDEFVRMQENKCLICGTDGNLAPRGRLFVDHDHQTKQVRGLLCHYCNLGIAQFKDNHSLLERAALYVQEG